MRKYNIKYKRHCTGEIVVCIPDSIKKEDIEEEVTQMIEGFTCRELSGNENEVIVRTIEIKKC